MGDMFLDDPNLDYNREDRNSAMWSHLGAMLGVFIPPLNLVIPFIFHNKNKGKSDFVCQHAAAAFNFQLAVILLALCAYLMFSFIGFTIGFLLGVGAVAIHLFGTISAAVKAKEGYVQSYPITLFKIL